MDTLTAFKHNVAAVSALVQCAVIVKGLNYLTFLCSAALLTHPSDVLGSCHDNWSGKHLMTAFEEDPGGVRS